MRYSVDRFEGGYAVLTDENGRIYNVEAYAVPGDISEGDMVSAGEYCGKLFGIRLCADETAERRERIHSLFEKIKNQ